MNRDVRIAALALALLAAAQGVGAIGFGRLPDTATLGQPLDLAIPLRVEPGEVLPSNCLTGEVSFADTPQSAGAVSLRLDPAAPDAERRVLRLSTVNRVDEPVVTVEITVGCAGRVSRRFTLFADPPLLLARAPPPSSTGVEANPASPATASAIVSTAAAPSVAGIDALAQPRPRVAPPRRESNARAAATPPPAARAPSPSPKNAGPRLRLSPPEDEVRLALLAGTEAAEQRASAAEAAASAASAAQAVAVARAAQLEAANAALRSQAASAEQALAALRAQLHGERSPAASSNTVPALLGLITLLIAGLVWLWHQRNQEREANAWLLQEAGADDLAPDEAMPIVTTEPAAVKPPPPGATNPARAVQPPTLPWSGSQPAPLVAAAQLAEHKREVSVEELIDLEQQAEFFVVLGQDEAAIDLLMGHLRSTAGNSPLPYLKLLEIYKRRGERQEYERLRGRFNSRFAAMAPAWEMDLQDGRSLEDYPSVTGRLENLWARPQSAMEVLQTTLLRADGQTGSSDSFDLPAYRELMLLYAVARDRSESEDGGSVDLLLPLEEDGEGAVNPPPLAVFERLLATTSLEAQPSVLKPLAVDLHLDDAQETKPAAMHVAPPHDRREDASSPDRNGGARLPPT
ncbi:MAG: hypothetical protein H0W40_14055 [Methylibium sp.]|uniref:type IV pilus assembly protein FimV n=1 Tax=Methylibium sp. TaxID=2067992 RepID=UPI0018028843|nr:hypothetical protein [Methylibium sp.]MBA3598481.1 hypothetical protein [Methylibium sp.]